LLKVLFASAEAIPFAKTGGLADVVGTLPRALVKAKVDARIIVPLYGDIAEEYRARMRPVASETVQLGWRRQYCGLFEMQHEGVTIYFVDNEYYFRRKGLYNFYDEAERFGFFSKAVLDVLPRLEWAPDIIHCHDWHVGMIPVLLRSNYCKAPWCSAIKTICTVHNLEYQGVFPHSILGDMFNLDREPAAEAALEFYGMVNFLKGGLEFADYISTVSPSYAQEIQTRYWGEKLDGVLKRRSDRLVGIVNGIDADEYNPGHDSALFANYSARSFKGKVENKARLQELMGLEQNPEAPLFGVVSRLVKAKGFDLVHNVIDEIMAEGTQLVVLGSGEHQYEAMFQEAALRYPGKIAVRIGYDDTLARRIYSGADLLLMPSLKEPCGISQLIAMRYGCIPLVREIGGLVDTVESFNPETNEGTGFSFTNYNAHDMLHVIRLACNVYRDKKRWTVLMKMAMKTDHSWKVSAKEYISLYRQVMEADFHVSK
jgi:starch synthase